MTSFDAMIKALDRLIAQMHVAGSLFDLVETDRRRARRRARRDGTRFCVAIGLRGRRVYCFQEPRA